MSIQIVHDDPDPVGLGIALYNRLHHLGKFELGSMFGDPSLAPARERLAKKQNLGDPMADIFGVFLGRVARRHRDGRSHLGHPLTGRFVETHHGTLRVIGFRVHIKHILPSGDKVTAYLGNAPFLLLLGLEVVFLR
jgi:hypothetical protein